jgi:hypothetical protein
VSNHHSPLLENQLNELQTMFQMYQRLNNEWIKMLSNGQDSESEELEQYALVEHINQILQQEVLSIKNKQANFRNSSMLNSYMLELRDLVQSSAQMVRHFILLK